MISEAAFKEGNISTVNPTILFKRLNRIFDNFRIAYRFVSENLHSEVNTESEEYPLEIAPYVDDDNIIDAMYASDNIVLNYDPYSIGFFVKNVQCIRYDDSVDVRENRVVRDLLFKIRRIIKMIRSPKDFEIDFEKDFTDGEKERLDQIERCVSCYMSESWLSEVSDLDYIPFESTVLQQGRGYSDLFKIYLMVDRFIETGGDERFDLRNLPLLYEKWGFIKLCSIMECKCEHFEYRSNGDEFDCHLNYDGGDYDVSIRSHYSYKKENGSYATELEPDISFVVHKGDMDHLFCFDTKFRSSLAGDLRTYENSDIEKMCTYRDGIIGCCGAYILYPGDVKKIYSKISDEKIHEVGAIPMRPSNIDDVTSFIFELLRKVDCVNKNS